MTHKNVIEINGRLYDARSGTPLDSPAGVPKMQQNITHKQIGSAKTVDGFPNSFSKRSSKVQSPATPVQRAVQKTKTTHRTPSQPQKAALKAKQSLTLNRRSVAAPAFKPQSQVQSAHVAKTKARNTVESSALKHVGSARLVRAQAAAKSPVISRFSSSPVTTLNTSGQNESLPAAANNTLTQHLAVTHPSKKPNTGHQAQRSSPKEEIIKNAVHHALSNSGHAPRSAKKKHSFKKFAPAVGVALVLSGYVAYLNVPDISMKVAAHRAGFAATMPGYKPSGYSLSGPIAANPGEVSVNYASNTDDRNFKLKQQPTTWDSTALLENLVIKKSPNYLTYQDRGLTIYIFEGSSAAWVNGGKLYQVEGSNSRLDTDQLLKIATSV